MTTKNLHPIDSAQCGSTSEDPLNNKLLTIYGWSNCGAIVAISSINSNIVDIRSPIKHFQKGREESKQILKQMKSILY